MPEINTNPPRLYITDPAEILTWPGFQQTFDPSKARPIEILHFYRLKCDDYVACGIAQCRQSHGYGAVILLSDRTISNIGNCCGKREFGDDFKLLARQKQQTLDRDFYLHHVRGLKEHGLDALHVIQDLRRAVIRPGRQTLDAFRLQFPQIMEALIKRAHRGDDVVFRRVRKSDEEQEVEREMLRGDAGQPGREPDLFRSERVGQIAGLAVLVSDLPVRMIQVCQALRELEEVGDIGACSTTRLRNFFNAGQALKNLHQQALDWEKSYKRFYNSENFDLFEFLEEVDRRERARLHSQGWDFLQHCPARAENDIREQLRRKSWLKRHGT